MTIKRDCKIEFSVTEDMEKTINYHVANSPCTDRATWIRDACRKKISAEHEYIISFKKILATCAERARTMCRSTKLRDFG